MMMMETTKATTMPTIRITASEALKARPNFTSFKRLAPAITGTARKKVNSAAVVRDMPRRMPPRIVAPEREVPGNTAAISWKRPTPMAAFQVISAMEFITGFRPLL